MFTFLAVGTVWFWIVIGFFIIFELVCAEDALGWAIGWFLLFTGFLWLGGAFAGLGAFVVAHPFDTIGYVAGYLFVGFLWTFVKWWRFLVNSQEDYNRARAEFMQEEGLDPDEPIPADQFDTFRRRHGISNVHDLEHLTFDDQRERICGWAVFWPFSVVFTAVNDPVRRVLLFAIDSFKSVYKEIGDAVQKNMKKDLGEHRRAPTKVRRR